MRKTSLSEILHQDFLMTDGGTQPIINNMIDIIKNHYNIVVIPDDFIPSIKPKVEQQINGVFIEYYCKLQPTTDLLKKIEIYYPELIL